VVDVGAEQRVMVAGWLDAGGAELCPGVFDCACDELRASRLGTGGLAGAGALDCPLQHLGAGCDHYIEAILGAFSGATRTTRRTVRTTTDSRSASTVVAAVRGKIVKPSPGE
jgi:hypothetical protein